MLEEPKIPTFSKLIGAQSSDGHWNRKEIVLSYIEDIPATNIFISEFIDIIGENIILTILALTILNQ
jgi:hypothetical protein